MFLLSITCSWFWMRCNKNLQNSSLKFQNLPEILYYFQSFFTSSNISKIKLLMDSRKRKHILSFYFFQYQFYRKNCPLTCEYFQLFVKFSTIDYILLMWTSHLVCFQNMNYKWITINSNYISFPSFSQLEQTIYIHDKFKNIYNF